MMEIAIKCKSQFISSQKVFFGKVLNPWLKLIRYKFIHFLYLKMSIFCQIKPYLNVKQCSKVQESKPNQEIREKSIEFFCAIILILYYKFHYFFICFTQQSKNLTLVWMNLKGKFQSNKLNLNFDQSHCNTQIIIENKRLNWLKLML